MPLLLPATFSVRVNKYFATTFADRTVSEGFRGCRSAVCDTTLAFGEMADLNLEIVFSPSQAYYRRGIDRATRDLLLARGNGNLKPRSAWLSCRATTTKAGQVQREDGAPEWSRTTTPFGTRT
jgi:hypothetical protein